MTKGATATARIDGVRLLEEELAGVNEDEFGANVAPEVDGVNAEV